MQMAPTAQAEMHSSFIKRLQESKTARSIFYSWTRRNPYPRLAKGGKRGSERERERKKEREGEKQ